MEWAFKKGMLLELADLKHLNVTKSRKRGETLFSLSVYFSECSNSLSWVSRKKKKILQIQTVNTWYSWSQSCVKTASCPSDRGVLQVSVPCDIIQSLQWLPVIQISCYEHSGEKCFHGRSDTNVTSPQLQKCFVLSQTPAWLCWLK